MRDLTFTELDRLEAVAETDQAFHMDEETFRAFYDRTARSVWAYLSRLTGDAHPRRRSLAGNVLPIPAHRPPLFERSPSVVTTCSASPRIWCATANDGIACNSFRSLTSKRPKADAAERARCGPTCSGLWRRLTSRERELLWPALRAGLISRGNRADTRAQDREHQAAPLPRQKTAGAISRTQVMTAIDECPNEPQVVESIVDGRWPHACDAALVAHAADCVVCGEVVAVASAVHADYDRARAAVRVSPPAGWSGGARSCARRQIAETAASSITCVHALTGAVAAGLSSRWAVCSGRGLRASIQWIDAASQLADVGTLWVPLALAVEDGLVRGTSPFCWSYRKSSSDIRFSASPAVLWSARMRTSSHFP